MPNIGVKQTEPAAELATRRVVPEQTKTIGVIGILAFVEIFYLRCISFDAEFKELMVWFYPKKNMLGGAFSVNKRIFSELKDVVYTEHGNSTRVSVPDDDLFVSGTGNSFQDKGADLTGSVCFAVKMDPKKFPKQAKSYSGILTLRLKNGQEYQFRCR